LVENQQNAGRMSAPASPAKDKGLCAESDLDLQPGALGFDLELQIRVG
jgi:hypothetical protein